MKSAATLRSTTLGKAITVLALLAIAGFATLVFRNESLKREPQTVEVPLGGLLRKLAIGDAAQKRGAMQGLALRMHTALEFPQVVQALISVLQDDDTEDVQVAAAVSLGSLVDIRSLECSVTHEPPALVVSLSPAVEQALVPLLDDPSPKIRAAALKSLGQLAAAARLDAPPQGVLEHYRDDPDDAVRIAAADALVEFGRGPEILLPVVLSRFEDEPKAVREASAAAIERIRLLPSTLPLLIEGFSSDDPRLSQMCAMSLGHIGHDAAPAVPALLALIRKEMDAPRIPQGISYGNVLGSALLLVGRIKPVDGPVADEASALILEILKRGLKSTRELGPGLTARSDHPQISPWEYWSGQVMSASRALQDIGRPFPAAVPFLLEAFEMPRNPGRSLYSGIVGALYVTSRGTPDEARVNATLLAALRGKEAYDVGTVLVHFGPEAERHFPDLKRLFANVKEPPPPRPFYRRWKYERPTPG